MILALFRNVWVFGWRGIHPGHVGQLGRDQFWQGAKLHHLCHQWSGDWQRLLQSLSGHIQVCGCLLSFLSRMNVWFILSWNVCFLLYFVTCFSWLVGPDDLLVSCFVVYIGTHHLISIKEQTFQNVGGFCCCCCNLFLLVAQIGKCSVCSDKRHLLHKRVYFTLLIWFQSTVIPPQWNSSWTHTAQSRRLLMPSNEYLTSTDSLTQRTPYAVPGLMSLPQ